MSAVKPRVIGRIGGAAKPVLPNLRRTLEDGDPKVRAASLTAIGEIVEATEGDRTLWEGVGKALAKTLRQENDSQMRQRAADALRRWRRQWMSCAVV